MVFKVYIIPLGHNCNITFLLENVYKINQARNPFEWNTSNSITKIVELFRNNFKNFIKKEQIPISSSKNEIAYQNEYDMIFNHDSDFDEEKREFFIDEKVRDKVYEKYSRRIKRMYEKIEEADRIIFFRTAPGYEFEKQKKFIFLMKKKNQILNKK